MLSNILSSFGAVLKTVLTDAVTTAVSGSTSSTSIQQNIATAAKAAIANVSLPDVISASLGTLVGHATVTWTADELATAQKAFLTSALASGDVSTNAAFLAGATWASTKSAEDLVAGSAAATASAATTKTVAASAASEIASLVGDGITGAETGGSKGAAEAVALDLAKAALEHLAAGSGVASVAITGTEATSEAPASAVAVATAATPSVVETPVAGSSAS